MTPCHKWFIITNTEGCLYPACWKSSYYPLVMSSVLHRTFINIEKHFIKKLTYKQDLAPKSVHHLNHDKQQMTWGEGEKGRKGKKPKGVKALFNNGSLSLKRHTIIWPTFHSQERDDAGQGSPQRTTWWHCLYFIEKRWERSKQEERRRERLISLKRSLHFSQLVHSFIILPHSSAFTMSIDSPPPPLHILFRT